MEENLTGRWTELVEKLNRRFEADLDLNGILFLIGIQELGKGFKNLSKDEKMDVMHIATCRILSRYGYYEFEHVDADGWPHYATKKTLPRLSPGQQNAFMKKAILDYFEDAGPS